MEGEALPERTLDDLMTSGEDDEDVLQTRREEREERQRAVWASCDHGGRLSEKLRGHSKAREKGATKGKGKERAEERAEESASTSRGSNITEPMWGEEGMWKYKLGESRCDVCSVLLKDYIWLCEGCGIEACMACRENGLWDVQ